MRVAVVGAGWAADVHAAAYAAMPGIELAAIVSRSEARAKALADKYHVRSTTDFSAILKDRSIDAVDVCVPSGLHRGLAVSALESGKHVFTETPVALTLDDADAMIDAAKESGRTLAVAQVMNFVVPYQLVHAAVASGELGRIRSVSAARLSAPYWSPERPRDFAVYGEPILELMIFEFEYLHRLLGPPDRVAATAVRGASGFAEHAWVNLEYSSAIASVEGSAMMPRSHPFTTYLRVHGNRGTIETRGQFTGGDIPATTLVKYPMEGKGSPVEFEGQDPYYAECAYFAELVRGKTVEPSLIDAWTSREALRVALLARDAARRRKIASVN